MQYLINTWLQPGDPSSPEKKPRRSATGQSVVLMRKEVAMNQSPIKLRYVAVETIGRRHNGKQIGLGNDAPRGGNAGRPRCA